VAAKQLSVRSWFDPDKTAVVLREAYQLQTAIDKTDELSAPVNDFPVRIVEALVEESWLKLELAAGGGSSPVNCLAFQGGYRPFSLTVEMDGTGCLRCRLDARAQKRLRARPALAQLGVHSSGKWTPQSQLVLITNLQDIVTGRDVRRERQIRE